MVSAPTPLGKGSTRAWGLMPSASVGFVSFEKPTNRVYRTSRGRFCLPRQLFEGPFRKSPLDKPFGELKALFSNTAGWFFRGHPETEIFVQETA